MNSCKTFIHDEYLSKYCRGSTFPKSSFKYIGIQRSKFYLFYLHIIITTYKTKQYHISAIMLITKMTMSKNVRTHCVEIHNMFNKVNNIVTVNRY